MNTPVLVHDEFVALSSDQKKQTLVTLFTQLAQSFPAHAVALEALKTKVSDDNRVAAVESLYQDMQATLANIMMRDFVELAQKEILRRGGELPTSPLGGVTNLATGAVGGVTNLAGNAVGGVTNLAGNAVGGVVNIAWGATHMATSAVTGVVGTATGAVSGVANAAGSVVGAPVHAVKDVFSGLWSMFGMGAQKPVLTPQMQAVRAAQNAMKQSVEELRAIPQRPDVLSNADTKSRLDGMLAQNNDRITRFMGFVAQDGLPTMDEVQKAQSDVQFFKDTLGQKNISIDPIYNNLTTQLTTIKNALQPTDAVDLSKLPTPPTPIAPSDAAPTA